MDELVWEGFLMEVRSIEFRFGSNIQRFGSNQDFIQLISKSF